jgi:hypothetical protein
MFSVGHSGKFDTLGIVMSPLPGSDTATVDAGLMPLDEVQAKTGLPPPTGGTIALVLSFNQAVTSGSFQYPIGYKALHDASFGRSNGVVYVIAGINGAGCFRLTPMSWDPGSTNASLDVDIQH